MPVVVYILVEIEFVPLAVALIFLSKWRMFAVRMRYWLAHIRANAVDIMVGLSAIVFMTSSVDGAWRVIWALAYGLWLIFLKPGASTLLVSLQAGVAQLVSLMALFLIGGDVQTAVLVIAAWLICYLCARHFFTSFDESYASLYAHAWGYFAAALVWVLSHWLLFYGILAQPTLLLVVLGYGMAALYYLDQNERLSVMWRRQFIVMMIAIVAVVLTFSDWGDRAF